MVGVDPLSRLPLVLSERFEAFPPFSSVAVARAAAIPERTVTIVPAVTSITLSERFNAFLQSSGLALASAAPIPERTVEIVHVAAPLPTEKIIEVMVKRTEPEFVLTMPVEQKSRAFIHPDRLPLVQSASPGLDEDRKELPPLPAGWRRILSGHPVPYNPFRNNRASWRKKKAYSESTRSSSSSSSSFIPRGMRLTPDGQLRPKHRAGRKNRAKVRTQVQALSAAQSAAAAITRRLETERQSKERREERVQRGRRSLSSHRQHSDWENEHRVVIRGDMWRGPALQLADTIYAMESEYKCLIVHQHTLSQNTDGKCVISIFARDDEVCSAVATKILRLAIIPGLA